MKLKTSKNIAIFAVAALSLGSAGVYMAYQKSIAVKNPDRGGVYADQAKNITDGVSATGEIRVNETGWASATLDFDLRISIANSSNISSGDFIVLTTDNLEAYPINGQKVVANGVEVGRVEMTRQAQFGGEVPQLIKRNEAAISAIDTAKMMGVDQEYHIIFNDKAKDFSNMNFEIKLTNNNSYSAYMEGVHNFTHKLYVNGNQIAEAHSTTSGIPRSQAKETYISLGRSQAISDGSSVKGEFFDIGMIQVAGNNKTVVAGDIIEMILPSDSGVAFDSANNPKVGEITTEKAQELCGNFGYNVASNGVLLCTGVGLKYKVLESSSHKLRYEIVEIADQSTQYQFLPAMKILDTSEKTINYDGKSLNSVEMTVNIIRGKDTIFANKNAAAGDIVGSTTGARGNIIKRGSVLVKYLDASGNLLKEEVLLADMQPVDTAYSAEKAEFSGLEFKGLGDGSAPLSGVVKEGVQNIILVYGEKSEDKQSIPGTTKSPEAPNTGAQSGILPAIVAGISGLALATFVAIRKKF